MLCKNLIKQLLKKQTQRLQYRSQAYKSISKLVNSQQQSFINVGVFSQLNEQFTDQEMKLQKTFNNIADELDFHHKDFNEKYLDSFYDIGGNTSQNNNLNLNDDLESQNYNHIENQGNQSSSQYPSSTQSNPLTNKQILNQTINDINMSRIPRNFQSLLNYLESVFTVQEKLHAIEQYCISNKQNTKERDYKQKEYILQFIQPVIKNINQNPSNHSPETLYSLLNISRHDFLNFPLTPKVISEIKKNIQLTFKNFEVDQIKYVFFASCMQYKDTQYSIIEPFVYCYWFKKMTTKLLNGECNERDLILFLSYNQKEIELFSKTNRFLSHHITKNKDLIERFNNPELIKVLVSVFCKQEKGSYQLYILLMKSLYYTIEQNLISITQFQIILRNLLRSQLFLSFRIISSYTDCQNLTDKTQEEPIDFISESDGEKAEVNKAQYDQVQYQLSNLQNESQEYDLNTLNSYKSNLSFKIIDKFVRSNIQQLSNNQILNVLNLYQSINAQNYRSTVIELLEQIQKNFNTQCDNFFTFNIVVRSLCLFQIEDPSKYLNLFDQSPKKLADVQNYQLQIANTFLLVREMFPEYWNSQFAEVYSQVQKDIQKNYQKTKMYILKQQQFVIQQKKDYLSLIQSIFERLNITYSQQHIVESTHIDFFIKPSNSQESSKLQLPQVPFTIDIITQFDEMGPGILNGNLTIKGKIFHSLKIPYIILKEEFCQQLQKLNPQQQNQAFIKEIQQQISKQQ